MEKISNLAIAAGLGRQKTGWCTSLSLTIMFSLFTITMPFTVYLFIYFLKFILRVSRFQLDFRLGTMGCWDVFYLIFPSHVQGMFDGRNNNKLMEHGIWHVGHVFEACLILANSCSTWTLYLNQSLLPRIFIFCYLASHFWWSLNTFSWLIAPPRNIINIRFISSVITISSWS